MPPNAADPRVNVNPVGGTPLPPTWAQGPQGPPGPAGPIGPVGPEGEDGQEGIAGDMGPAGATGATGAVGPAGPVGPQGLTGPGGVQGPAGPIGPVGPAGGGITYKGQKATVAALPPTGNTQGDAWSVTADNHLYIWDGGQWTDNGPWQGPQGVQGPIGATGATGPQGAPGPQGAKGDTGNQGAPGATGSTGPQGATGAQGAQGTAGTPGATGAQGPAGPGVPTGGTATQVLAKVNATDYNTNWITQTPGLTLPLTQNLTFSPDATYDIGASATTRPRDVFVGRNVVMPGGGKILGDFSNATLPSRTLFQTSVANGASELGVIPNGTATGTFIEFFNKPDPANAGEALIGIDAATAYLMVTKQGTGVNLPLSINVGGAERMNFAAGGAITVLGIMTTTDITMSRAAPNANTAALWFGNTSTKFFYWDGTTMSWNGSDFKTSAAVVAGNGFLGFGPQVGGGWPYIQATASPYVMTLYSGDVNVSGNLFVSVGSTRIAQMQVSGSSNGATGWTNVNNTGVNSMSQQGGVVFINDTYGAGGCGGTLLIGTNNLYYCGIRGVFTDGSSYGQGRMSFATRANASDSFLTERLVIDAGTGTVNIVSSRFSIGGDCSFVRGGAGILSSPGLGIGAGFYMGINGFAYGSGGYCLGLPNVGNGTGMGVAYQWPTYACVDHAIEFGLDVNPIKDPVAILKTLSPYHYQHMSIELGAKQPRRTRDGEIVSRPTYGMRASQVKTLLPEIVGPDIGEPMTIDYARLVVVLWAACQQLEERIGALEAR